MVAATLTGALRRGLLLVTDLQAACVPGQVVMTAGVVTMNGAPIPAMSLPFTANGGQRTDYSDLLMEALRALVV